MIERRERVAHAAFARLRQDAEHLLIGGDAFLLGDPFHARHEFGEIDRTKTELLAAGLNRSGDLVRFGGAQDENHPLGRLLQSFEKSVERFAGDLVGFIHDEDFIPVASGTKADTLAQFAHFIDAAIRSGVDFDDIDRRSRGNFSAARAYTARGRRWALDTVQTAGENSGDGGFSGTALSRKDVSVGDPPLGNGVFERGFDVFLADQLAKYLGAILAGNDLIHWEVDALVRFMPDPG